MGGLGQLMVDFRWAMNALRARRWRRHLYFSDRLAFDNAIRPRLKEEPGKMIAYPDAFYHITVDDLCRAMLTKYATGGLRVDKRRIASSLK